MRSFSPQSKNSYSEQIANDLGELQRIGAHKKSPDLYSVILSQLCTRLNSEYLVQGLGNVSAELSFLEIETHVNNPLLHARLDVRRALIASDPEESESMLRALSTELLSIQNQAIHEMPKVSATDVLSVGFQPHRKLGTVALMFYKFDNMPGKDEELVVNLVKRLSIPATAPHSLEITNPFQIAA
jgi:hypothetical protein